MNKYPTIEKYTSFSISKWKMPTVFNWLMNMFAIFFVFLILAGIFNIMKFPTMFIITIMVVWLIWAVIINFDKLIISRISQEEKNKDYVQLVNEYSKLFKDMDKLWYKYIVKDSKEILEVDNKEFEDVKLKFDKEEFWITLIFKIKDEKYKDWYRYEKEYHETTWSFDTLYKSYKKILENTQKEKEFKKKSMFG